MYRSRYGSGSILGSFLLLFCVAACATQSSPTDTGAGPGDQPPGDTPAPPGAPPGATGTGCAVSKKGTAGLVIQGRILGADGPLDGEVQIDGSGKITCVAASCAQTAGYGDATVLACGGGVVSPGLINAHDHTEYATRGPVPHATTRWDHRNGWRTGAGGETKLSEPTSTTDAKIIAAAELRFLMGGATSVNGSGGVPGLMRNVANYMDKTQLEGLSGPSVFFDTFPLGDSNGTELTTGCGYPKVRSASSAFAGGAVYSPHISEGINPAAENEFECLKGSLVTNKTGIIHGVGLNAKDVDVIAKAGAKLIWSARTNVDLYGNTASITVYKNMGVTIGLGTDWLASGSMNMLRELACVDSLNQKYFDKAFDDRALVDMATKGSAAALGLDAQVGELAVGKLADIAIFSSATQKDYRAVIDAGVEDVLLVLRGGKPLYGDETIISALAQSCSELDVCGTKKSVCVDTAGVTLANIQSAASSTYPLFFCKTETPKDEPSCVPYRDTYPMGTSATDRDGDGIPDAMDICPAIFDPPRPLDGTKQADSDGDGVGDACDAKPLDANAH
ncbi:MAG TPA: amidohydrolase family protein [Labilithrix sp.]